MYPFLLSVFEDCYVYHNIESVQVCQTMDVILSYVVRRLLCEMPTNALNKVFATMAKDVEHFSGMALSEKVSRVLSRKKGKVIFPNDNILKEHMITRNTYKFPHIKFVLEQIERNKSKETVAFDSLTIEHIMPQTLTAKWGETEILSRGEALIKSDLVFRVAIIMKLLTTPFTHKFA